MREIKFRAWDGNRIVNNFVLHADGKFESTIRNMDIPNASDVSVSVLIDPIVMQYTGLKDKNGVEIYEGDLLDFDIDEWGMDFKPEVVTMEKLIDWDLCGTLSDISNFRAIIGNIYENPELLND